MFVSLSGFVENRLTSFYIEKKYFLVNSFIVGFLQKQFSFFVNLIQMNGRDCVIHFLKKNIIAEIHKQKT
jgi:hypothetical protein